jgi:trimeric autotransporter adhesin
MSVLSSLLCLPFLLPLASAQQYTISTVAGIGLLPFGGEGGPALNARLITPAGVAADAAGNVFVSDQYYSQVFRISASGTITTYAGNGQSGFSGDGGPATAAQLNAPSVLALDSAGNLYIADTSNGRVRKVTPDGTITTLAASGGAGVAVDAAGNVYISQSGFHVIHLVRPDGTNTIIAGASGKSGSSGDGGKATSALLFTPLGLALDGAGNLYVADSGNYEIRKITPQGNITTVAGSGKIGFAGDNLPATAALMSAPAAVAIDPKGNLYISDSGNFRVRVVSPAGVISTFAGGVSAGPSGTSLNDGPPDQADLQQPSGLAVDSNGNLLIALALGRQVRRVTPLGITTIAGLPLTVSAGENIPAASASLLEPFGITFDNAGALYVSDTLDQRIKQVSTAGIITTFAGNGLFGNSADGGPAFIVGDPRGLAFDRAGNLYFSALAGAVVRRIAPSGAVTTLAGGSGGGFSGDGSAATGAKLSSPCCVAVDAAGILYISDSVNNRIRRVDLAGKINTIAGNGLSGSPAGPDGDNGPATSANLSTPRQVALDNKGNVYVPDLGNNRIRKIAPAGVITTVAGNGVAGGGGDGGPATAAQLNLGGGLAVDATGNLYIGTTAKIRKVDASTGVISTVAGTGVGGFSGDGGPATLAAVNGVSYMALDSAGNIYFTDANNQRVRRLSTDQIVPGSVLNGASELSGPVSPGEVVDINGTAIGSDSTQVLFDGTPATLISTQTNQLRAIVPYEVAGQTTTQLQIAVNGKNTNTLPVAVANTAPGIFTLDGSGKGPGGILNGDFSAQPADFSSVNSSANPAARGSLVTVLATGEGQTNPPGVDGQVPAMPIAPVSVQIGGNDAPVMSAGGGSIFVQSGGYTLTVFQVVAQVPSSAPTGDAIPIVVTVGGVASQPGVTVSVQ